MDTLYGKPFLTAIKRSSRLITLVITVINVINGPSRPLRESNLYE